MKILIISGIFYPEQTPRTFRTSELAIQLAKYGHDVKLIVPRGDFDFVSYSKKYNVEVQTYKPWNTTTKISGSKFLNRVWSRCMRQFFSYPQIKILRNLRKVLLKNDVKYDLLISIAAPHAVHWTIGLLYKSGKKIADKWIADCGDPFMLNATDSFAPPFYFRYLEELWNKECDFITVPTDSSYRGYYPEYHHKIRVIPQGFNFEEVKLDEYCINPVPTFAFSGAFILKRRDPRPILDYMLEKGYNFKAIFYTKQIEFLEGYAEYNDKIEVRSYIPRLDLIKELSKMDFLLNLENGTNVQTPSKLIDYALAKRPILSLNCQNINKIVLDQFMNGNYDNQRIIENLEKYNIENVALSFVSL